MLGVSWQPTPAPGKPRRERSGLGGDVGSGSLLSLVGMTDRLQASSKGRYTISWLGLLVSSPILVAVVGLHFCGTGVSRNNTIICTRSGNRYCWTCGGRAAYPTGRCKGQQRTHVAEFDWKTPSAGIKIESELELRRRDAQRLVTVGDSSIRERRAAAD